MATSALKILIDTLPDAWKMKKESVLPYLKKRGIKEEELDFSGIAEKVTSHDTPRLTKADMQATEKRRQDIVDVSSDVYEADNGVTRYHDITIPDTDLSTYSENIYTSKASTGYVDTGHFDDPEAIFHTRTSRANIEGLPSKVVQEIQSDFHQEIRKQGLATSREEAKKRITTGKESAYTLLRLQKQLEVNNFPKAPYKSTWLVKGIEAEAATAVQMGDKALVIPLSGPQTGRLQRSEGVQKWYETDVRNTLKKFAKRIGGEYKEVQETGGIKKFDTYLNYTEQSIVNSAEYPSYGDLSDLLAIDEITSTLRVQLEGLRDSALNNVKNTEVWEQVKKTFAGQTSVPTVTYGQVVFPKDSSWTKQLKLYSAGGAGATTIDINQFLQDNDLYEAQ